MNEKQQAAKTEINRLAIKLLELVNKEDPYTDADVSEIKNLALRMRYETNDLNDYEELGRIFSKAAPDLLTADDYPDDDGEAVSNDDPEDLIG